MLKYAGMRELLYSTGRVALWVHTFTKLFRVYIQMNNFIVCKLYLHEFYVKFEKPILKIEIKIKVLVSNDIIRWLNFTLVSCNFEKFTYEVSPYYNINIHGGSFQSTDPNFLPSLLQSMFCSRVK